MERKTGCIINVFIIVCVIAVSFQSLLLYSSSRRLPAGKRPLGYSGPTRPTSTAPTQRTQPAQSSKPTTASPEEEFEEIQEESEETKPETKPQLVSDVKEAQIEIETPSAAGWWARVYATMVPIILVTLDKSIGTGIAKSTESVIDDFLTRRKFLAIKSDILLKTNKAIEEFRPELKNKSDAEKLEIGKGNFLSKKEAKSFDKLERETSISSIVAQAVYIGMLNVTLNLIGTLFGLGTSIGVSALMPTNK